MTKPKIYTVALVSVYLLHIQKAKRKNRTQAEVDEIIYWLAGYDEKGLQQQSAQKITMEISFEEAPNFSKNTQLIKGVACGYRVGEIEDPLMQKIRCLDELIDELAKGRAMEKILRTRRGQDRSI